MFVSRIKKNLLIVVLFLSTSDVGTVSCKRFYLEECRLYVMSFYVRKEVLTHIKQYFF